MKILFICHELPTPSYAGTLRVLNSLEYLSKKYGHDIILIGFRLKGKEYPDLSRLCRVETVIIPAWPGLNSPLAIISALLNILRGRLSFFNYLNSPEMRRRIKTLLNSNRFDVIAIDHPVMIPYALNIKIPTVLLEAYAIAEINRMEYRLETNWFKKAARLLYYLLTKNYTRKYRKMNLSIAVSNHQRDMVKSHCPDLNITVIPYGVDTDYLKPVEPESASPSLNITASMSGLRNKSMVLRFYHEIYPLIKAKVPGLKLYIVGSNPEKEILRLGDDETVTVTGYVADIRPYLSRAWVVAAPLEEGFGVKVRVLQAMAIGKPVVATSAVMNGIGLTPGENIIIADDPREFAGKVVELLGDRQLRERIGAGARRLMVAKYGREKASDKLNEVLERAARTVRP